MAAASPAGAMEWRFSQCFGEKVRARSGCARLVCGPTGVEVVCARACVVGCALRVRARACARVSMGCLVAVVFRGESACARADDGCACVACVGSHCRVVRVRAWVCAHLLCVVGARARMCCRCVGVCVCVFVGGGGGVPASGWECV